MEDWKNVLQSCGLGEYAKTLHVSGTRLSDGRLTVCFDSPGPIPEGDAKRIQDALAAPFIGLGTFEAKFNAGIAAPR